MLFISAQLVTCANREQSWEHRSGSSIIYIYIYSWTMTFKTEVWGIDRVGLTYKISTLVNMIFSVNALGNTEVFHWHLVVSILIPLPNIKHVSSPVEFIKQGPSEVTVDFDIDLHARCVHRAVTCAGCRPSFLHLQCLLVNVLRFQDSLFFPPSCIQK